MRTNRIYGLCALQLIGLGVQVINRMAGNFVSASKDSVV